ncbi:MAG TPA: helix-turn-helix transcriptional regulator [Chloroflexota bacterium]|nr:helix-turn-helix transcriptional regulator [Chloroflexota bacterium]
MARTRASAGSADASSPPHGGRRDKLDTSTSDGRTARDRRPADDPYDDPLVPLRVIGHGPAHPAGQASRELGRQLRAWREASGLSQRDIAERLGWEQPHVARLEAGGHTPNLATLDRLARRLGLHVALDADPKGTTVKVREAR